jgi:hypothetical protein
LVTFGSTLGLGFEINPVINATYAANNTCCETTQTLDVLVGEATYTGGLQISAPKVGIPGFSIWMPGFGWEGAYIQASGSELGSLIHREDQCANVDCWKGKIALQVQLTGGLQAGVGIITLDANVSGGIEGTLTVGCHAIIAAIGTLDVKATGSVSFPNGSQIGVNKIIAPAQTLGSLNVPFN